MKVKAIVALAAALCVTLVAPAQDFKPVKDKDSKKFGYQDKSKNWVISPQFDKAKRFIDGYAIVEVQGLEGLIGTNGEWVLKPEYSSIGKFDKLGLCELMVKVDRTKFYGLADASGRIVLPPVYQSVSVSKSEEIITARGIDPDNGVNEPLWGVYSISGEEIFSPQFTYSPSFRKGVASATSGFNGRTGLIDIAGNVLLPFENLAVSSNFGDWQALTTDFSIRTYDSRLNVKEELRSPGSILPYDTFGDDVRAAAWHCGCIGKRLHYNNVRAVQISRNTVGRTASMSYLPLDWGYCRFIRLEPEIDTKDHPGRMEHPYTGQPYTLRALLYEADGSYIGVVSDWGWLEAEFPGGWIYNSEGNQKWIIFEDPNYPVRQRGNVIDLPAYNPIDGGDVISGLCLSNYDLKRMQTPSYRAKREQEIIEGENVGITSYLPHPAPRGREESRVIKETMRSPMFRHSYYLGDVVNCELRSSGDDVEIHLSDRLICHFIDKFPDLSFDMEGDEEIFWGPNNSRTVALDLEPADHSGSEFIEDDIYDSKRKFKIVINMYEEDGSFLRTLGEAPCIDFMEDGIIVFERLGIALINRGRGFHDPSRRIKIPKAARLIPRLSVLQGQKTEPGQAAPRQNVQVPPPENMRTRSDRH